MSQSEELPPAADAVPPRVLGLLDATFVVIGAIVGVGIFFSPRKVAALCETPGMAIGAWAFAGFLALAGALAFAELGRRFNSTGAQYRVLKTAWGSLPAFIFVFCNATAVQAGAIGVIAIICADNLAVVLHTEFSPLLKVLTASGLIGSVTVANILGVKFGSGIQWVTVIAKIAALGLVIFFAAWMSSRNQIQTPVWVPPSGSLHGFNGVIAALVPAFFAYGGWQHSLWIAGEVKDPKRNLPRAILFGVLIVVATYISVNWAYLTLLGHAKVAESRTLAADAIEVAMGTRGRQFIAAAVAISAFGVLNAQLLSGPRLIYGMARDGQFFEFFGKTAGPRNTPVAAIVLLAVFGAVLLYLLGFDGADQLTNGVVFIDGIFFALTAAALLLPKLKASTDGHSLPLARVAAAIFVIGEVGVVIGSQLDKGTREASWYGMAWIAAAICIYFLKFQSRDIQVIPGRD